jgi:hypothetical protein
MHSQSRFGDHKWAFPVITENRYRKMGRHGIDYSSRIPSLKLQQNQSIGVEFFQ